MVGPRLTTKAKDEPSRLRIFDRDESLEKRTLLLSPNLHSGRDELGRADRGPQDRETRGSRVGIARPDVRP
jgi:hypothetical protein